MQGNRGFTLVELMVTIAVVAILAMIAAPSMSSMLAKQRLNSTTRDLAATLSQARSQAALLRREVTVTLNSNSPNTQTNYYWNPPTGNTLTAPTPIPNLVFRADGTLANVAGGAFPRTDFIVCNSEIRQAKTITLSRMGTTTNGADRAC